MKVHSPKPRLRAGMLTSILVVVLAASAAFSVPSAYAQEDPDSVGTEYVLGFMENLEVTGDSTLLLFIAGGAGTTGTVEVPGLLFSTTFSIPSASEVATVLVNVPASVKGSDVVVNRGVRVVATDEVAVYGLNRAPFHTDAFLGLPVDLLGTEYIVLGREDTMSARGLPVTFGPSEFLVVAVEDETTLTITPSISTRSRIEGVPYSVTLSSLDAYQLQSDGPLKDLSRTTISSNKPIAVFAGAKCTEIPVAVTGCDHLVEQLPPTDAWGSEFLTVSLATRTAGDQVRILARDDGTEVRIDGTLVATLAGATFTQVELPSGTNHVIETSGPSLVMQYAKGFGSDLKAGDPFMVMVVPTDQFLSSYTIATPPPFLRNFNNFVNLVVPQEDAVACSFDDGPISEVFSPIGSSGFSAAQLSVSPGSHVFTCPNPFGAYVYGWFLAESYGYPAGMQFSAPAPEPDPTPRELKQSAIAALEAIRDDRIPGDPGVGDPEEAIEEINGAIEHIEESLNPDLWARTPAGEVDPFRLDPHEGEKVFEAESEAAEAIFEAIDDGEITGSALIAELRGVVDLIVGADRLLAQTAINDAKAAPNADQEEIADAEESLGEGDLLVEQAAAEDPDRAEDLIEEAIEDAFGEAWEDALEALEDDDDPEDEDD